MPLITITQGVTRHPDYRLAAPVNFSLHRGEHLAICGPNGAGKSLLTDMLTGARPLLALGMHYDFGEGVVPRPSVHIGAVTFRHVYGSSEPAYYQQRWNRADEQEFPTVAEVLAAARQRAEHDGAPAAPPQLWQALGIEEHLEQRVNLLSSGERRRLQLAQMLVRMPQVLVVDNPYIGLDAEARGMLTEVLQRLAELTTLVLVVSRAADVPPFIDTVVPVSEGRVGEKMPAAAWREAEAAMLRHLPTLPPLPAAAVATPVCSDVIDFRHVTIRYGTRTILHDLTWCVRRGEHWALTGENGAGKSTLLSLVCADNPQGYACDIRLFGRQRGRGESIWDIKKHIGYVSPEMAAIYRKSLPSVDIVASGLHDTVGLYRRVTESERALSEQWLATFGAAHLARRDFMRLSSGEQRLVLLVRAFVKSPSLLILDEPFHGLDEAVRRRARALIDAYMAHPSRTLIMVTHYADELPACIDHHLTLHKVKA